MKPTQWSRALPRYTLPLMTVTWIWQAAAFYLPKLLMDGKPHFDLSVSADGVVPFIPASVIIYLAAFITWPLCYLYCAAQNKERAYRFLCAEFLAKAVCLISFWFCRPPSPARPSWDIPCAMTSCGSFIGSTRRPTCSRPSIV